VACSLSSKSLSGALRIQRLEGSRSPESVLCIFYRTAASGLDRRTSVADRGWVATMDYAEMGGLEATADGG